MCVCVCRQADGMLYAGLSLNRQHMPMQSAYGQHTTPATHRHTHSPSPQHIAWTGTAAAGGLEVHRHAPGKARQQHQQPSGPHSQRQQPCGAAERTTIQARAMQKRCILHNTHMTQHQEHVMQRHALATTQPQPRPLHYARQACAVEEIANAYSASIGVCQHQRAHTGTHITCAWAGADLSQHLERCRVAYTLGMAISLSKMVMWPALMRSWK